MTALKPNTTLLLCQRLLPFHLMASEGDQLAMGRPFWNNDINTECLLHVDVQPHNKGGGATLFPSHLDEKVCGKRKRHTNMYLGIAFDLRLNLRFICVSKKAIFKWPCHPIWLYNRHFERK